MVCCNLATPRLGPQPGEGRPTLSPHTAAPTQIIYQHPVGAISHRGGKLLDNYCAYTFLSSQLIAATEGFQSGHQPGGGSWAVTTPYQGSIQILLPMASLEKDVKFPHHIYSGLNPFPCRWRNIHFQVTSIWALLPRHTKHCHISIQLTFLYSFGCFKYTNSLRQFILDPSSI